MKIFISSKVHFWKVFFDSEGLIYSELERPHQDTQIFFTESLDELELTTFHQEKCVVVTESIFGKKIGELDFIEEYKTNYHKKNFSITCSSNVATFRIYKFNKCFVIFYDPRINNLLQNDNQSIKRISISNSGNIFCHETLNAVDKRHVKSFMRKVLYFAAETIDKNLFFIWKYPYGKRNIFNLRIDVDPDRNVDESIAMQRIRTTVNLSEPYKDRVSMALNLYHRKDIESFLALFKDKFDICSHNFYHWHFPDLLHTKKNIDYAESYLFDLIDSNLKGFVSPEYFWSNKIFSYLFKKNYKFSSSFGFDFSSFPYSPINTNSSEIFYEIPSHPIVYGKIKQVFGNDEKSINEKYIEILDSISKQSEEPMTIYEHPAVLGQKPKIFDLIMEFSNSRHIAPITLSGFYKWLILRENFLRNIERISIDKVILKSDKSFRLKDLRKIYIAIKSPHNNDLTIVPYVDYKKFGASSENAKIIESNNEKNLINHTIFYESENHIKWYNSPRHLSKVINAYKKYYKKN